MAVQGDKVMYGVTPTDAEIVLNSNRLIGKGGRLPVAGDQLPAFVTKDHGGTPQKVDLHVLLNGGASLWVGEVPQGTTGQQGKWW